MKMHVFSNRLFGSSLAGYTEKLKGFWTKKNELKTELKGAQ